jgi:hypothetical protein
MQTAATEWGRALKAPQKIKKAKLVAKIPNLVGQETLKIKS